MAKAYGVPVILHTDHCAKKLLPWIDGIMIENEKNFKLEQFRAIDNGVTINVLKSVSEVHLGVDTEEDLNRANEIAKENNY